MMMMIMMNDELYIAHSNFKWYTILNNFTRKNTVETGNIFTSQCMGASVAGQRSSSWV